MGKNNRFTEHEIRLLEENPNVKLVSDKSITYTPSFKLAAVEAYAEGQTPMEIFQKAGFDMDIIGHQKPKDNLKRWRATYEA
ncbi:MAG TPA: HTH domain-containing protein, partial [Bacilli bacterium]|nr:HTH domain-containing protein [Bacilli bacterium]